MERISWSPQGEGIHVAACILQQAWWPCGRGDQEMTTPAPLHSKLCGVWPLKYEKLSKEAIQILEDKVRAYTLNYAGRLGEIFAFGRVYI